MSRGFAVALIVLALLLVAFLLLVRPAWSATRCTTYEERTLGRRQTLCDDGTQAISRHHEILDRGETRVRPPRPVVIPPRHPPPKAPRR